MRITQTIVERLAAEAERRTGRKVLEGISRPGDGRTRYVMSESMISTYSGARNATAYLLGILAGSDPDGSVHWVENRPGWITEIDSEFRFGQTGRTALAAHQAGTAYGKTLRSPA